MNNIEDFFQAIHVKVENQPEAYGIFHITFVIISLLIIFILCYLLRKNKDKTFRIILCSVGGLLILSEIFKQLYYFFVAGETGYDWHIFPFQLCSVPMYLSFVVGFLRKSKIRDIICEYLASIGLLGGIMAYIEPSGILNGYYFTLIHSCIWHALLIFIGLYTIITNNACSSFKNYKKALIALAVVVVIATTLNIIFKNKSNFNMCYISPFYNTPLAVFSSFDVLLKNIFGNLFGRICSIIIYIIALILGGFIVYELNYLIKNIFIKKTNYLNKEFI